MMATDKPIVTAIGRMLKPKNGEPYGTIRIRRGADGVFRVVRIG